MAAAAASSTLGVILIILQALALPISSKCTLDINKDYTSSSPLILDKQTYATIYPEKTSAKTLSFAPNHEQIFYCAGGYLTKNNRSTDDAATSEVTKCVVDRTFADLQNHRYAFDEIACSKRPSPATRYDESRKCRPNGAVVDIGYQVTKSVFKRTIDLCYVKDLATTAWSHSTISAAIGANKNRDSDTPAFGKGSFFGNVLMTKVYPKTNQQQRFMTIFENDKAMVDKYLPQDGPKKNYFVKGHLVARADMYYQAEQYSSYFYVNVLPMWQSINNGNWKSVESTVRRTAAAVDGGELDVWTGGIGVLRLSGKDIYLANDKKNASKSLVPAPKLLFKIVASKGKSEGLVFVTVNDPYFDERELPKRYTVCEEYRECGQKFKQFKQRFEGYTYCCLVGEFFKDQDVREMGIPVDAGGLAPLRLR